MYTFNAIASVPFIQGNKSELFENYDIVQIQSIDVIA